MEKILLNQLDVSPYDLKMLGGKASSLRTLSLAGFPVPPGFVLFEEISVPPELIDEIGGFPVAVRSSGSLEDLGEASFAGQYETFLDVNSLPELQLKIKECFLSRDSQRVRDYLQTRSIEWTPESLRMSVLIQKMVDAQCAGVLFTMNPLNGREEEIYLELCKGVGERLVSGIVTPTRIVYDWPRRKKLSEVVNSEGTRLSEDQLHELMELAANIQAYFGTPQDIEWAIGKDKKVYILQSRPITTFTPRSDCPELTNADFKDGGVSARVCTPFMYSVYREALKYSMGDYFKKINLIQNDEHIQWIYHQYGRVYWNVEAVKEGLKAIPDFREDDFDRDLGIQKNYGESGPHVTTVNISSVVKAIPVLLGLNREYRDCLNMILLFRTRFESTDEVLKEKLGKLQKLSTQDFIDWFQDVIRFQNETEKNYFRTIYNNSNFQSEYKSYLKKLKGYTPGDEIDLMGELHGVSHLDLQSGLKKLQAVMDFYGVDSQTYYSEREKFLKIHYHHGPAELDLKVPRWGEKKEWVDELVKNFVDVPKSEENQFHKTFLKIRRKLSPLGRLRFKNLTESSRNFLRLREEMRSFSTRAYYLLRIGLLEFARRFEYEKEEIFFFDILEIKKKLSSPSMKLPDVTDRKRYYDGYRNFKAPNEFGGKILSRKKSHDGLRGLGCSPGIITGRARVILDIHKTHDLTKDEILVTLFTDPGWTPVLARVGGVITEVGGLLSHAAVIGREYKIPAVLNLVDATTLIQDGDLIRVDGRSGEVEILEKAPKS